MPVPEPGGRFHLINDLPSVGGLYFCHYAFETLIGAVPPGDPKVPTLIEYPARDMRLAEWNPSDLNRLSGNELL